MQRGRERVDGGGGAVRGLEPEEALRTLLAESLPAWIDSGPEDLDLDAWLAMSAHVPLPPAERLRRLGAFLDDDADPPCPFEPFAQHQLHERIYGLALQLDPASARVWASRSFSAARAVDIVRWMAGDEEADEAAAIAVRSAREAVRLGPELDFAWYCLGRALYGTDGSLEEAREAFVRAVQLDPGDGWNRVYLAHCDHDLERWEEAVAGYEAAIGLISDLQPWRRRLYQQQRSWCLLRSGRREEALQGFVEVLGEVEAVGEDAWELGMEELDLLFKVSQGALREELYDRVEPLRVAIEGED